MKLVAHAMIGVVGAPRWSCSSQDLPPCKPSNGTFSGRDIGSGLRRKFTATTNRSPWATSRRKATKQWLVELPSQAGAHKSSSCQLP